MNKTIIISILAWLSTVGIHILLITLYNIETDVIQFIQLWILIYLYYRK